MPDEAAYLTEKKIAEALDLPREKIREIRTGELRLKSPEHFRQVKREVVYLPSGLARLLEYLRSSGFDSFPAGLEAFCGSDGPPEGGEESAQDSAVESLVVVHICRNKRLIDAKKKNGEKVRVRVPDNRKFVPKMELRARSRNGAGSLYDLVGRCPRKRGRY